MSRPRRWHIYMRNRTCLNFIGLLFMFTESVLTLFCLFVKMKLLVLVVFFFIIIRQYIFEDRAKERTKTPMVKHEEHFFWCFFCIIISYSKTITKHWLTTTRYLLCQYTRRKKKKNKQLWRPSCCFFTIMLIRSINLLKILFLYFDWLRKGNFYSMVS